MRRIRYRAANLPARFYVPPPRRLDEEDLARILKARARELALERTLEAGNPAPLRTELLHCLIEYCRLRLHPYPGLWIHHSQTLLQTKDDNGCLCSKCSTEREKRQKNKVQNARWAARRRDSKP
jgi:hypothetical protein